jgi:hypothetical protein
MSRRQQHPLIVAMNKFDTLLASLTGESANMFVAYVRNKVATRRVPKSASTTAPSASKRSRQRAQPAEPVVNTEADVANAMTASGD